MSETIIGKVSLAPCGEFQMGKLYKKLSTVSFEGSNYIAAQDNQNVSLDNYGTWYLLSKVGNTISNIILLSTSGYTSTYRVNFTDGTFFDFEVNDLITKTSQLTNDSGFITNQVDDLQNYLTKNQESSYAQISIDNSTYQIIVRLFNSDDEVLSTQSVTMPIEKTIINASYENATITLIARDNSTFVIPINDILLNTHTIAGIDLRDNINATDLAAAIGTYTAKQISDLLDPINEELTLMESNIEKKTVSIVGYGQLTDSLNGQIDEPILKGNTTQVQSTGKNKFDPVAMTTGTYYTLTNDIITISRNNATSGASYTNTITLAAGTYTLSFNPSNSGTNKSMRLIVRNNDANTNILDQTITNIDGNTRSGSFTLENETTVKFAMIPWNASSGTLSLSNIQLELGSAATEYEPYTNGKPTPAPDNQSPIVDVTGTQEVVVSNKNLLDTSHFIRAYVQANTGAIMSKNQNALFDFIPYIRDNITVVCNEKIKEIDVVCYDKDKHYIDKKYISNSAKLTADLPINTAFIRIYINYDNSTTITASLIDNLDLQATISSTTSSYVPHKGLTTALHLGDIHLRSIPDTEYRDRIYHENGKWNILSRCVQSNLTKNSGWEATGTSVDEETVAYRTRANYPLLVNYIKGFCDYFRIIDNSEEWLSATHFGVACFTGSRMYVRVQKNLFPTATDFANWIDDLPGSTLPILVPRSASVSTEITPQNYPELYVDLEQLAAMQTYKPETNISIFPSSGNGVILDFIYWTDEKMASLNSRLKTLESQVALLE